MAVIRDIHPDDRERWEALFLEYGVFYETGFDRAVLDGVWAWLMDDAADVRAFVAVEGDEVIGFTHYRPQPDTFTAAPAWFLDDLFVDPAARGSGAATALIEAVAEYATAHGGGTLRWITADDNHRAQRVYDRIATKATWVTYEREC
ncbi:MAG: GNAT family N-acetyltransferase [Rhodoglobus sp.]